MFIKIVNFILSLITNKKEPQTGLESSEEANHMKEVEILRIESPKGIDVSDQSKATIGIMRMSGKFFCFTLEPPDRNNGLDSCIPVGEYSCKRYSSAKYPDTFEVTNVPNRSYILIHSGNIDKHSLGCILLGSNAGYLEGKRAVLSSKSAFKKFMKTLGSIPEFNLVIKVV